MPLVQHFNVKDVIGINFYQEVTLKPGESH